MPATSKTALSVAKQYYSAMNQKDLNGMGKCIADDIQCFGPLAVSLDKQAVLETGKRNFALFDHISIKQIYEIKDGAVVVYDMDCPPPVGKVACAAVVLVKDDLITRIDLFHDARAFERKG